MSEIKLLTDSVKDQLYTNLLNSIDRKFAKESIALPPELVLWFSGRKAEVLSRISNKEVWEIFTNWRTAAIRALNNHSVTWDEFCSVFPEPFRSEFRAAFLKIITEE